MNILVIDDEQDLRQRIQTLLKSELYRVESAATGTVALDKIANDIYDLILLDIMLPDIDGLAILQEIRANGITTPVLMLTARGDVKDRIKGLDLGADDYLAKPFSPAELLARIRALLRRQGRNPPQLNAGPLRLDPASREVSCHGHALDLTAKEFAILEFLLYNKGRAISRFSLAEHVWGDNFDPFTMSNFIDVHMKNLRRKISPENPRAIIRTLRGIGFIID